MSSFARYKFENHKKETPVIWYRCAYCGRLQSRRASKVKNRNLIFCDNTCRARYSQKKSFDKIKITSEEIKQTYGKYHQKIVNAVMTVCNRYNRPDLAEDFKSECFYGLWRCMANSRYNNLQEQYVYKFLEKHLVAYYFKFHVSKALLTIDETNLEKNVLLGSSEINTVKIENYFTLQKLFAGNLSKAAKAVIDFEVAGISAAECMTKYNFKDRRQMTINIYNGKKELQRKWEALTA